MYETSALAVLVALGLAAVAVWSRRGRSRAARWWVRPAPPARGWQNRDAEAVALVVLPCFAQLALAVAVGALPGMPNAVIAALVVGETAFLVVVGLATAYRWVMPLFLYPGWLRPVRAQEKEEIRRRWNPPSATRTD